MISITQVVISIHFFVFLRGNTRFQKKMSQHPISRKKIFQKCHRLQQFKFLFKKKVKDPNFKKKPKKKKNFKKKSKKKKNFKKN